MCQEVSPKLTCRRKRRRQNGSSGVCGYCPGRLPEHDIGPCKLHNGPKRHCLAAICAKSSFVSRTGGRQRCSRRPCIVFRPRLFDICDSSWSPSFMKNDAWTNTTPLLLKRNFLRYLSNKDGADLRRLERPEQ